MPTGRKIFSVFLITLFVFSIAAQFTFAKADEIVIKDNGEVVLILDDNGVLGTSTTNVDNKQQNNSSNQSGSKPSSPSTLSSSSQSPSQSQQNKTIPLVAQGSKSTININPNLTKDNKINVTIVTKSASTKSTQPQKNSQPQSKNLQTTPSPTTILATSPFPSPKISVNPSPQVSSFPSPNSSVSTPNNQSQTFQPITKVVDQVVEEDANGQSVLSIKPKDNKIMIQQSQTQVSTAFPLQIDNQTHQISVTTSSGLQRVSLLPNEAVRGATNLGIISNSQNTQQPKITLTQANGQVVYKIEGEKRGKLLGIFNVNSKVEVDISAQTGKAVNTSEPFYLRVFGFLIK